MRMLGVTVHMQLLHDASAERIFRYHAVNRVLYHLGRIERHLLLEGAEFFPSRVPGVPEIPLGVRFLSGKLRLFGIDDDHIIAMVLIGRISDFVFPDKDIGDL